jgi:UDP-N-acetylglucosamine 4-epimerase
MPAYLITGGAGFIGSNMVEALLKQGEKVTVLDDFSTGSRQNLDSASREAVSSNPVEVIDGDIRDINVCRQACRGADYIIHLAALGSVSRSVEDPLATNDVNIRGTLNMLMAARDAKAKRFVYASSSSAYGDSPTMPKHEEMPTSPLSPYAVSKLAGENYCQVFSRVYKLPTISLRYFNVFGRRQDPTSIYSAVIPIFCALILAGKQPVIFGDGAQSRDFTYIDNVVSANLLACRAPEPAWGGVFNIACGQRIDLLGLCRLLAEILNKKIEPRLDPPRPGDIKHSLADISRAEKFLGYKPKVHFKEGLIEAVAWYQKNLDKT